MEFNQIETRIEEVKSDEARSCENDLELMSISLEAEVPEALYVGMRILYMVMRIGINPSLLAQLSQIFFFKMVLMIGQLLRNT